MPDLIDAVKRGVMLSGALPIEFPVISVAEPFASPTSMFLRNLMAMDAEEMIRAQPMDAVVLIGGCDKDGAGAAHGGGKRRRSGGSCGHGAMLTGEYEGERLGACTDCRRLWGKFRAGEIDAAEINSINGELAPTAGTCMVMGTASTMALLAETLGMMLPGGACIPAVHAERLRHAEASGARAVALIREKLRPSDVMTPAAFSNAFDCPAGGRRVDQRSDPPGGNRRTTGDRDRPGSIFGAGRRTTPVLVDLKPSGQQLHGGFFIARVVSTASWPS